MIRAWLIASWLAACGPGVHAARATSDDAIVTLKSNVRDAQVYVDGRFIAPLAALAGGMAVEPGTHRVELRHEDYFSSYLELRVGHAEHKKIVMNMARTLP